MPARPRIERLRIGMVGSGFIAKFHLRALLAVRHVSVSAVYSPTPANREALAREANDMELGPCRAFDSLEALATSGTVDALWLLLPNFARIPAMREIHRLVKSGKSKITAVACEKPLARTLAEAREMLRLADDAGLNHGYLENQVFAPAVQRGKEIIWRRAVPNSGRPYLARAAEEHSGPHMPWFWQGSRQGGGVLSDMTCHSVEVARYLLTKPGAPRGDLKLISASATTGHLKWTRPAYVKKLKGMMGKAVDYARHPAEDFARGAFVLRDSLGHEAIIEVTNSWAYVGPGLRIQIELLGPEYAMEFTSLNTGLKIFHVAGDHRQPGRGSGGKTERRTGADAGAGGRGQRLWLCRGEPTHGGGLPPWPEAHGNFQRRRRRGRDADGPLPLGRNRQDDQASVTGAGKIRTPGCANHPGKAAQPRIKVKLSRAGP
ncbi:MAG TPA: Gfo/Idh/MocA family oxidoreductase [Dongiaceae bacterium]|nr:Gfo/Idh/MocA family oxidoreductase [Dongiaceae bacterium]